MGGGLCHRRRHAEVRAPLLRPDGLSRPARSAPRVGAARTYTRFVSLDRRITGGGEPAEPLGGAGGMREERPASRSTWLGDGTLACPRCDAPVVPGRRVLSPAGPLDCGYCRHEGAVRDFLSLAPPTRPTRVAVHVRLTPRRSAVSA